MLFNSLHFLFFFTWVTLFYFSVPKHTQWILLLLASCYFYAAFIPAYLGVLFLVIIIDYVAALWIERSIGLLRKTLLIISLVSNIGILAFFKYYDFFNDGLTTLISLKSGDTVLTPLQVLLPGIILPIGLSFHTFQSMSYTIEVYRGNYPAERHFGIYSLYVLFYPQLVAGPIERPQNILPQLHQTHSFDWVRVRSGLMMMGWGLFKKVVIADRFALLVDPVYADVRSANGGTLLMAVICYSIQIYCDFSGYSDMAIGAGKVMGIKMMENFRTPYLSRSITEFWRRWHISLSTWFRDYVYIPLGGNRVTALRASLNLLIVFGISGLWHGANWKFIIWGLIHGFCLVVEQGFQKTKKTNEVKMPKAYFVRGNAGSIVYWILTFSIVSLAWIFFRATSLADAGIVLGKLFSPDILTPAKVGLGNAELLFCGFLIGLLFIETKIQDFTHHVRSSWLFWTVFPPLLLGCYLLGTTSYNQFIYFQF